MVKWYDKSKLPARDEKISFVVSKRERRLKETKDEQRRTMGKI